MDDILELAKRLGSAIAQSPQAAALRETRKRLDEKPEVKRLLEDFRRQSEKIGQLEQQKQPVEVEDKRKLQDLHDKLVSDDVFKQYTAAQVEYVDLMRKVSSAMTAALAPVEGGPAK